MLKIFSGELAMRRGIGIDAGTFHTVAVGAGTGLRVPARSIPSIALRAAVPIVGIDAISQLDLKHELLQAPKLSLDSTTDGPFIRLVIRTLVDQALKDLGQKPENIVLTVPPGWTLDRCNLLEGALSRPGLAVRFIHEPIALLIAVMHLAPKLSNSPTLVAQLDSPEIVLVCDWGAGTVDLAIVRVGREGTQSSMSCVAEVTDEKHGGTTIARDIVRDSPVRHNKGQIDPDKEAYRLQAHWQDDFAGDFGVYIKVATSRRREAAQSIGMRIAELMSVLSPGERRKVLFLLHGGPLESDELRSFLISQVTASVDVSSDRFVHVGNDFAQSIIDGNTVWRRDALVAAGASLFASRGESIPEFEYEIKLEDSAGMNTSNARLVKRHNTRGKRAISPPHTDQDYIVSVQQMRGDAPTAISAKLGIFVRAGAIVIYSIKDAGVGFATIEAAEAQNEDVPVSFSNSLSDSVRMPESSTKFVINLE